MVPNCTNGWRKTKGTGVSYHCLPTNHMKSLCLQRVHRDNPRDSKHSFVCSDHFNPESYECSLAEKLCGHTGRKILKPDAVPTICENVPKTKRVSSEMRCRVRERNEILYYTGCIKK